MKLPFMQFFPSDYMRDTRSLSCAAKGGWMDVLCMLHGSSTRGTMTLPIVGWARIMGASVDQAEAIIAELEGMHVPDITRYGNGDLTITCRRMLRESITREQTRLRVERHRRNTAGNAGCNGHVTDKKSETKKLETKNTDTILPSAKPTVVDPRHREITSRWGERFALANGIPYQFDAGKDVAENFELPEWVKQAATIHGLCNAYNDIRLELAVANSAKKATPGASWR